jgi:hypothetical protein
MKKILAIIACAFSATTYAVTLPSHIVFGSYIKNHKIEDLMDLVLVGFFFLVSMIVVGILAAKTDKLTKDW